MESTRLESCDIHGGKILIIGDLHLSAKFSGKHRDYAYECFWNLERIVELVKQEKASAVIFLGDLIGVNEKNIGDHQFLMRVITYFNMLNNATNGNVYSVKGNHDMGQFTDFDLLTGIGYIKNPRYINYYGRKSGAVMDDGLEVRFHLVNYGDEDSHLKLAGEDDNASNVILGHNEYYIEGVTNWYSKGKNVELAQLSNFIGVDLVISGHIHTPSDEILYTTLKNGQSIGLFYTGAPGRVSERFDDCWYLTFEYCKNSDSEDWFTEYESKYFGLQPASEVFYPNESFVDDVDEVVDEEKAKSDALTDIVKEIMEGRITSGDLNHQIDIVPGVSDEVKQIAKDYLEKASKVS